MSVRDEWDDSGQFIDVHVEAISANLLAFISGHPVRKDRGVKMFAGG